jgi:hypothetical protein
LAIAVLGVKLGVQKTMLVAATAVVKRKLNAADCTKTVTKQISEEPLYLDCSEITTQVDI